VAVRLVSEPASPPPEIGFGERAELCGHARDAWRFGQMRVRGEMYRRADAFVARLRTFENDYWREAPFVRSADGRPGVSKMVDGPRRVMKRWFVT
jgi:hypothetical protein